MPMARILTRNDALEIIRLRTGGMERKQIAKVFHVSPDAVRHAIYYFKLEKQYRNAWDVYRKNQAREAIKLRKDGYSIQEILERLEIGDHRSLYGYLRFAGTLQKFKDAKKSESYGVMGTRRSGLKFADVYLKRAKLGMTCSEIAKDVGCHPDTVKLYCRRNNIPKATREEAIRNKADLGKTLISKW